MEKKAAGFIIFRKMKEEFEYLLLQASYSPHHWTPPKGHNEAGETDIQAAYRETKEEAGFDQNDLKVIENFKKTLKYTVNNKPKVVTYWLAELLNNKPVVLSSEHQDYKWANLDNSCKLAAYQDFQELLKTCDKYLHESYKK